MTQSVKRLEEIRKCCMELAGSANLVAINTEHMRWMFDYIDALRAVADAAWKDLQMSDDRDEPLPKALYSLKDFEARDE